MDAMSWRVDFESDQSVSLVHDEEYLLFAKRGAQKADMTEWSFELTDTSSGEQLISETRDISNSQHLWSVLEKYKRLYPP